MKKIVGRGEMRGLEKAIDVAIMTYNSEKYLDECLASVFKAVNVRRLIVVDHYSNDETLEIARKYHPEIYFEDVGLAYARQLAIEKVETPIFMFIDSDVVFHAPFNWFDGAIRTLDANPDLGAIVMRVSEIKYDTPRQQYQTFWHESVPFTMRIGFTTGSTFIKKSAIEGLLLPSILDAREDRFMELYIEKRKRLKIDYFRCRGIHYFDHARDKGSWSGANERLLTGLKRFPYVFLRRIITSPLKAIPPMIHYRNPRIFTWNTKHWLAYLKGFLRPMEYRKLKRGLKDA